jgi:ferredoxin
MLSELSSVQAERGIAARCGPSLASGGSMFRVIVDADTCESNGFCVGFAPDVFELHDESPPVHILAGSVGEDRRSAVEDAVRSCPRQAIRIESDEAGRLDG